MYWSAGRDNNNLYTINLLTGAATLVGTHGIGDMFALGYDGSNLYGQSSVGSGTPLIRLPLLATDYKDRQRSLSGRLRLEFR